MSHEEEYPYSGIACDNKGIITSYGIGAAKLFGWTPEEIVGKQSAIIFHEPNAIATLVPRLLKKAAETGKFEEKVTLVRKDGSKFLALLIVKPIKKGWEITGYMGLTRPISEAPSRPRCAPQEAYRGFESARPSLPEPTGVGCERRSAIRWLGLGRRSIRQSESARC